MEPRSFTPIAYCGNSINPLFDKPFKDGKHIKHRNCFLLFVLKGPFYHAAYAENLSNIGLLATCLKLFIYQLSFVI